MKKLLILLISLVVPFLMVAQEFNAGIIAGLAPSQLDGDMYRGYHKLGYTAGAYVNRFFTKKTGMQFGIRFIEKGSRESDDKNNVYYRSVLRYAEMPLSFLYNFKKHLRFEVGATLGYLVQDLEDVDGYGLQEPSFPFRKYELGSLVGIHYRFSDKAAIGIQHAYSITAVRPYTTNSPDYIEYGQHNNVLIIELTYTFRSWQ
jgi:hypothetical protein